MRSRLTWAVAAVLTLSVAPRAWAGHPQERRGFWIGFGFGYGSAGIDCDGCVGSDRQGAFTGFLKLGGTLSDHVLLGGEVNAWLDEEGSTTLGLGTATGTVTVYPWTSSGFFLKGGVGLSFVETRERVGSGTLTFGTEGWGVLTGLGYDLRVGRNISITPSINYYFGQPGDFAFEDGLPGLGSFKHDVIDFGIGVTFH